MKIGKFERKIKQESKNLLFNTIFAMATLVAVIIFYRNELLTTSVVIMVGIIGLLKWKSKITLALFMFAGIFGATAEMIVIYTSGAWNYAIPTVMQLIPVWLFVVWANAGAFMCETSKEIHKLGVKK